MVRAVSKVVQFEKNKKVPIPLPISLGGAGTAPALRTWLGPMLEVKYVLGSQEAISEAVLLGGCRL